MRRLSFDKAFTYAIVAAVVIFIVILIVNLARTSEDDNGYSGPGYYRTTCVNGVAYYVSGYKMAPAVDADTLTFIRCEVK